MLGPSPSNPPLAFPCGTDTPQKGFLLSTIPKPTMRHQVTETRLGWHQSTERLTLSLWLSP